MTRDSGTPLLSVAQAGKIYDNGTIALSDVNLTLEQGSFVSLVGPSGCGKSTLLRMIAGLIAPTNGAIQWPQDKARPADIGFVFQEATLMPWARVFDNVWLPLKLRGMPRETAREEVMAALSRVGLEAFAQAFPRELSGGMRMRVSIARAMVTGAKLLLMDEPFAALDEFTRENLDDDLLNLWQQQGWTVIFVTHSVYESVYLSGRVLVMGARPGRIIDEIRIDAADRVGAFRDSPAYIEHCRAVSAALRQGAAP